MAGDGHDDLTGRQVLARRDAGEQHRLPDRVAQRRDPEVVLQLGERLRERLGDRPGAVDRALRYAADLGGHRTGLEEPEVPVGGDRPLDVLRTAERVGDGRRQLHEPPQIARRELGTIAAVEVERPFRACRGR